MEQRYDPNQGMKWYKFLRVFLIVSLIWGLIIFVVNFNTGGYTYSDVSSAYPLFTAFSSLQAVCNSTLVIFLVFSLFVYSARAPRICLLIIASNTIFLLLLFFFSDLEGAAISSVGIFVTSSIFYYINYIYLRKRLVKKYWPARNTPAQGTQADAKEAESELQVVVPIPVTKKAEIQKVEHKSSDAPVQKDILLSKKLNLALIIATTVMLVISITFGTMLSDLLRENTSLSADIQTYKNQADAAVKKSGYLSELLLSTREDLASLQAFDNYRSTFENIGFIVDGSNYYHKVDCVYLRDSKGYHAHNTGYCKHLGYKKCPVCFY